MKLTYTKAALAIAWVFVIAAVVGSVTSPLGWVVAACLALLPPIVVFRVWNDEQTVSESIKEVLR
jgi:hypothetical protein